MGKKTEKPAPCPICKNPNPEIDYGLSDAPFETPFVHCTTIHVGFPDGDFTCPMNAHGIRNWNALAALAKKEA